MGGRQIAWLILLIAGCSRVVQVPSRMEIGSGAFNVSTRGGPVTPSAIAAGFLGLQIHKVGPTIGIMTNGEGAFLGYLGLYRDFTIGDVRLTPFLANGFYVQNSSKDLGGPYIFRWGGEASTTIRGHRIGIAAGHESNAGIYRRNAGAEEVWFWYEMPVTAP